VLKLKDFDGEIEDVQAQLDKLQAMKFELAVYNDQADLLEGLNGENISGHTVKEIKSFLEEFHRRIIELNEGYNLLNAVLGSLKVELHSEKRKNFLLEDELSSKQKFCEQLEKEIGAVRSSLEKLEWEHQKNLEQIDSSNNLLARLFKDEERYIEKIDKIRKDKQQLSDKLNDQRNFVTDLLRVIEKELESSNKHIFSSGDVDSVGGGNSVKSNVEVLRRHFRNLIVFSDSLADDVEKKSKEAAELKDNVLSLEAKLVEANNKYRALSARYDKQKIDFTAANLRYRSLASEIRELRAVGEESLQLFSKDQLFWQDPLLKVLQWVPLPSGYLAKKLTRLAKKHYSSDPAGTLLLASLAYALHPKIFRKKWYGFALAKAGFTKKAYAVLEGLATQLEFSDSESRVYLELAALHATNSEVGDKLSLATTPVEHIANRLTTDSPIAELKVACILDEFTFQSFFSEAGFYQLTPTRWQDEIEAILPDFLFVESAWRGKDDLWGGKVGHNSKEIRGLLEWCNTNQVPTLFWNKEDPVHFTSFLTTAAQFDYVFTTDIDCVARYKNVLGHGRVYFLPFACQPEIHNPIEKYQRKDAFCFAGAYYARYPERIADLENFVEALPNIKPLEIYDRNFGKSDAAYMFPEKYQRYIVGSLPVEEIDKAYKGYNYAINLNSIKHSQSMFARRVFELLASNTITLSNYSRGIEILFGDLVFCSDSGAQLAKQFASETANESSVKKRKLAALRKVLSEHTYEHRLAYMVSKISDIQPIASVPSVLVFAKAVNTQSLNAVMAAFHRQTAKNIDLAVVVDDELDTKRYKDSGVHWLDEKAVENKALSVLAEGYAFIATFVDTDYYGPNYILDFQLATKYSQAAAFGKVSHFTHDERGVSVVDRGNAYYLSEHFRVRSSVFRLDGVESCKVNAWLNSPDEVIRCKNGLSIDEFNYCCNGLDASGNVITEVSEVVDDMNCNVGFAFAELAARADSFVSETNLLREGVAQHSYEGEKLKALFPKPKVPAIRYVVDGEKWLIKSSLEPEKHEYIYQLSLKPLADFGFRDCIPLHLAVGAGLNIRLVVLFFDECKERISHVILPANQNHSVEVPENAALLRIGFRIYDSGEASINGLYFSHLKSQPVNLLSASQHLVLTNHYPSYDDLYRNGFLHRRVAAYQESGLALDVFRLMPDLATTFHEFQGVTCITGPQEQLDAALAQGFYKNVLVHFMDQSMWAVLKNYVEKLNIIVWVHGAEIQPFHRRTFNYESEDQRKNAIVQSDKRMAFWRGILRDPPPKLKLVFVSKYFAEEVMADLGFRIPESQYTIIHNPIDTQLFSFTTKPPIQRKKVLSIRPYASKKYANDLSVKMVQALANKHWFKDVEFRFIGDGPLFDEVLEPLQQYSNVILEKRFLAQEEMAKLHKEYGVFLSPTRMDSQGVSRDEAMSSGLVPITNAVTAIPEFVDESCGILADGEDYEAMARGLEKLVLDEKLFLKMSWAASQRVASQTSFDHTLNREIQLICGTENVVEVDHECG